MKTKSTLCALLAILALSSGLTGCATVSSAPKASLALYQPRVIRLPAGQPVQTVDGAYTPQTDEVWHSAAAYRALEDQVIDLAAALAQERNRK